LPVSYYAKSGGSESFFDDMADALHRANVAHDRNAQIAIENLCVGYVASELSRKSSVDLAAYLRSLRIWRMYEDFTVYKTADLPCVAFAARLGQVANGDPIVGLAVCYRYPRGSEALWWQDVVLPRLISIC
jgi:hypothetical protein